MYIKRGLVFAILLWGTLAIPSADLEEKEAIFEEVEAGLDGDFQPPPVIDVEVVHEHEDNSLSSQALEGLQEATQEIKEISRAMLEILKENNEMLKSLLPKPEPQPETLNEVINIANPELSGLSHVPYIMEPIRLLHGALKFPEALNIHVEAEFILPENLGIRVGWSHGSEPDFGEDDLPYSLHIRWNGDHYEYSGEDYNRKLVPATRTRGTWQGPGVAEVEWPFEEYEVFNLDIVYKDGCFSTIISNERVRTELPMCRDPMGEGDLYLSFNSDKQYLVPVRINTIFVSLKETISI